VLLHALRRKISVPFLNCLGDLIVFQKARVVFRGLSQATLGLMHHSPVGI